jgi:hypothetical protein
MTRDAIKRQLNECIDIAHSTYGYIAITCICAFMCVGNNGADTLSTQEFIRESRFTQVSHSVLSKTKIHIPILAPHVYISTLGDEWCLMTYTERIRDVKRLALMLAHGTAAEEQYCWWSTASQLKKYSALC